MWSDPKMRGGFYPPGLGLLKIYFTISPRLAMVGSFEIENDEADIPEESVDQRTAAVSDVPSAHSILDDTSEQPPDCFCIRRLGDKQPQSCFGVHDDSADRLVDFGSRRR